MSEEISDKELGKRLSAGRGYARETTAAFARRIKAGRQELEQWEMGNFGSENRPRSTARKRSEAVKRVQQASGLPQSFFRIDLNDLDAMADVWRRRQNGSGEEPRFRRPEKE